MRRVGQMLSYMDLCGAEDADAWLGQGPWTVVDKPRLAPGGDVHDYLVDTGTDRQELETPPGGDLWAQRPPPRPSSWTRSRAEIAG
ncbi:hypothetical protein [Streptomyces sp. NPDC054866]